MNDLNKRTDKALTLKIMIKSMRQMRGKQGTPSYKQDSPEFNRVINLSDAVFAIAMTLLVLTLDIPDVPASGLASALAGQLSQFVAFLLSFTLVAIIWTQHHKFMEMLNRMEPLLIGLNLALLGIVVLVPYPTNLIGNNPGARIAVIFFITVFILLSILYMLMLIRARAVSALKKPMTLENFIWHLASWGAGIVVMLVSLIIAFWFPLTGLIILAVTMILGPLASKLTYME